MFTLASLNGVKTISRLTENPRPPIGIWETIIVPRATKNSLFII